MPRTFRVSIAVHDNCRRLIRGLIPFWARDKSIGSQLINARAETLADKPSFRAAVKHRRRCLVPASGFYEWKKIDAKSKQPYHIPMRGDRLFAFAGLWERWEKGKEPVEKFHDHHD